MSEWVAILRVIHVVTAILMAWPFYALVAVNHRARLGPPLGDRADVYMENIIRNRAVPCFIFQATALLSGLGLILVPGRGLDTLWTSPVLGIKFALLVVIAGLLAHVYFLLQPKIDALFARGAGSAIPAEVAAQIAALRLRRKRSASFCLFFVLVIAMLGVQAWAAFPLWLTAVLVAAIAAFTRRSYTSVTPYGWA